MQSYNGIDIIKLYFTTLMLHRMATRCRTKSLFSADFLCIIIALMVTLCLLILTDVAVLKIMPYMSAVF